MLQLQHTQIAGMAIGDAQLAGPLLPFQLFDVQSDWEQHLASAGDDFNRAGLEVRHHRVRVANKAEDDAVDPRLTEEELVEGDELRVRAKLPLHHLNGPRPTNS